MVAQNAEKMRVFVWGNDFLVYRDGKTVQEQSVHFATRPWEAADGIARCGVGAAYPVAMEIRDLMGKEYEPVLDKTPDGKYSPLSAANRKALSFLYG